MAGRHTWLIRASALKPDERYLSYAVVNRALEMGVDAAWVVGPSSFNLKGRRVRADLGDFVLSCDGGLSGRVKLACEEKGVRAQKVGSAVRAHVAPLRRPVVAIYHDFGIHGESLVNLTAALRRLGFSRLVFLTSSTIHERLPEVDVLFLPAGDSSVIAQGLELGGADVMRDFVAKGGCLVGMGDNALLAALPSTPERMIGPKEQEFQGPASLLRMLQCDVLNEFVELPAPNLAYRSYGPTVRVNAFQGEVLMKVMKPSHPIMFGYEGIIELYADGPIFATTTSSENLCAFHKPAKGTLHNLSEALAWRLATDRSAIVSGTFRAGKVVLASAQIERPSMPSTWPLLGNILFWCTSSRPPSTPLDDTVTPPQGDAFRLVDAALNELASIQGEISSLGPRMEMLIPRLLATLGQEAVDPWISSSRALSEVVGSCAGLSSSFLTSAQAFARARDLRASIELLASSKGGWPKGIEPCLSALSKAEGEVISVLSTASRALKILRAITEQMRRGVTEVASLAELEATIKADSATIRTLRCSALTVVAALVGGAPFHSPWYDGEVGPCHNTWLVRGQEGLIAPILGLASALERANMRLTDAMTYCLG